MCCNLRHSSASYKNDPKWQSGIQLRWGTRLVPWAAPSGLVWFLLLSIKSRPWNFTLCVVILRHSSASRSCILQTVPSKQATQAYSWGISQGTLKSFTPCISSIYWAESVIKSLYLKQPKTNSIVLQMFGIFRLLYIVVMTMLEGFLYFSNFVLCITRYLNFSTWYNLKLMRLYYECLVSLDFCILLWSDDVGRIYVFS